MKMKKIWIISIVLCCSFITAALSSAAIPHDEIKEIPEKPLVEAATESSTLQPELMDPVSPPPTEIIDEVPVKSDPPEKNAGSSSQQQSTPKEKEPKGSFSVLGDLDHDGDVDRDDLDQLLENYGVTEGATYEMGDLDGDGDVDLSDLAALLGNYGYPYLLTPADPNPEDGATGVSTSVTLSWRSCETNDSLGRVTYDVYVGDSIPLVKQTSNQSETTYAPGDLAYDTTYYWKIIAWYDSIGKREGALWTFTTQPEADTQPPSKVTGLTVTDAKDGTLDLSWNPASDNVAVAYYRVYRDDSPLLNTSDASTTYQDTGLTNGQEYTYRVSAVDTSGNEGDQSDPASGTPTSSEGGSRRTGSHTTNHPPTADTSAGEPYEGSVGDEIFFDASRSYDPDGAITAYIWDFGDGTIGFGETIVHSYLTEGAFAVSVTVVDDRYTTGSDETIVTIQRANSPPSIPEIVSLSGSTRVKTHKMYMYTAQSTDEDYDMLQYYFDWGDGTMDQSIFIISGTPYVVGHSWSSPGNYTVSVSATDGKLVSSASITVIAEDVSTGIPVENISLVILALLGLILFFLLLLVYKKRKTQK